MPKSDKTGMSGDSGVGIGALLSVSCESRVPGISFFDVFLSFLLSGLSHCSGEPDAIRLSSVQSRYQSSPGTINHQTIKGQSCIGQWGILSLLIDTQAKQTQSTQAGTAARQGESTRERGRRRGANRLLTNATNEGESIGNVRLWGMDE